MISDHMISTILCNQHRYKKKTLEELSSLSMTFGGYHGKKGVSGDDRNRYKEIDQEKITK